MNDSIGAPLRNLGWYLFTGNSDSGRKALEMEHLSLYRDSVGRIWREGSLHEIGRTCNRKLWKWRITILQGLHKGNLKALSRGLSQYVYWTRTCIWYTLLLHINYRLWTYVCPQQSRNASARAGIHDYLTRWSKKIFVVFPRIIRVWCYSHT